MVYRKLLLLIITICLPLNIFSQTTRQTGTTALSVYVEASLKNDKSISAKELSLASAKSSLLALEDKSILTSSIGSGSSSYNVGTTGTSGEIVSNPFVELQITNKTETSIKFSLPTSIYIDGSSKKFEPKLQISQNISPLIFNTPDISLLKARLAVASAEQALYSAIASSRATIYSALKSWASSENSLIAAHSALLDAEKELENAKKLGLYKPNSAAMKKLENAALSQELNVQKYEKTNERNRDEVRTLCNFEPDLHAPKPTSVEYPDISKLSVEDSYSVINANSSLEISKLNFNNNYKNIKPEIDWTASTEWSEDTNSKGLVSSIGLGYSQNDIKVESSGGWNGIKSSPFVSLDLSWVPENKKASKYTEDAAEKSLEAEIINYETTISKAESSLKNLQLESELLEVENLRLQASYEESYLSYMEYVELEKNGIVNISELNDARDEMYSKALELENTFWDALISVENLKGSWKF